LGPSSECWAMLGLGCSNTGLRLGSKRSRSAAETAQMLRWPLRKVDAARRSGPYTVQTGRSLMRPGLRALPPPRACEGLHLVVGGHPEGDPGRALASRVGEAESGGSPVVAVTLRMAGHDDAAWIAAGLRWLHAHGRRPLLRTAVALPR